MKRSTHYLLLGCLFMFASCQSLEYTSIDYLIPAEMSFPSQIRQVAIVNNVNINAPDNQMPVVTDSVPRLFEVARKVSYQYGDPKITAQSLAEAIAEANYFDEVIISDSVLRANDIHARETTLSNAEVVELTNELDVDMIIALENIQIKVTRKVNRDYNAGYWGVVEAKVMPVISMYIPSRHAPLAVVAPSDSIFWEEHFMTQARAMTNVVPDEQMIQEASEFAGTIPTKYFLPYWKDAERVYYVSNNSRMRDAAVMARDGKWDEAYKLWHELHQSSKKVKDKMRTAFNIGLYYEVTDNLDEAIKWVSEAYELAKQVDKMGDIEVIIPIATAAPQGSENYALAQNYLKVLKARSELRVRLDMQMQRFEEEN